MRNNHDKKTHKLGKRTFALCLALAVICSCLLPVFATGNSDATVMLPDGGGIAMPVAGGDGAAVQPGGDVVMPVIPGEGTGDTGTAGSGSESTGTPVTDPSSVAGVTFPEGATNIVKNPNGSYSYDTAYGRITVFPDADKVDTSDVVVKPNPNLKQDDAAFGVLPIEYHFWLKKMDSFDLDDLAWEAEMANLSETGYLNLYGSSKKFPIWHMDTISADDVMGNYTFNNPTSLNDPEGKGREFAGWYTADSLGVESEFEFYKSYGDESNTVINVYAKWKDASGDVVEEPEQPKTDDTKSEETKDETKQEETKQDETKKNETAKAVLSAEATLPDTDAKAKVTVDGMPANATHLSVTTMGDTSMENFYNLYTEQGGKMDAFMGFQIAPKDAAGNVVQPNGPVTVTITGLDELGLDALPNVKVLHQKADNTIETLDASYNNGVLTFQTTSFSPFVIAYAEDGQKPEDKAVTVDTSSTAVSVMVGATKTLNGGGGYNDQWGQWTGWNHSWTITSGSDLIKLTANNNVAYITGKVLGDGVQVKHTYFDWYGKYEETYNISVTKTKAAIYFLSSPAGRPDSNDTQYWSPDTDTSTWLADIHVDNATWEQKDGEDKNIVSNVGSYIEKWPNSTSGGDSWVLERNGVNKDAFTAILDSMWDNYKTDIANKLKVDPRTLDKGDISKITLKAYKISRNNSNTDNQFFHIDCTIDVVSTSNFTAKFWVKYPGNNGIHTDYRLVDTAPYKTNSDVKNTKVVNQQDNAGNIAVPLTMTKDGVTYRLTGWYPEDSTGGAYDANKRLALTSSWTYSPTKQELEDGTVNFYAHYEPISTSVTITKTVTGLLGDHNGEFSFTVSFAEGTDIANIRATKSGASTAVNNWRSFTLKDGETITFTGVPIGAVMTVTEIAPGKHYTVEATGQSDSKSGEKDASFTYKIVAADAAATDTTTDPVTVANNAITITNDAKLTPDAGVILDTLPYIVILAVVVGGGVMLFLRKRRKDDED